MRSALLLSLLVLMTLVLPPPVAALETISSGGSRTVVLPMYSHDAYELQIGSGETASIGFSADSNVDFYVMTASGYAEYVDPSSPSFHILDERENAQSFSHSTTQSGLILVIDNDDVTSSGASSTVSVTYDLTVQFASAAPSNGFLSGGGSIVLAVVAAGVVFSLIGAVFVRQRRRKQAALDSQLAVSPPPIGPTPVVPPAGLGLPVDQAPGAIRRSMNDTERDLLVRDFKSQRGRTIAGSMVGVILAVAYNVFPNLMTLGLSIIAFITLAMVAGMAKLRAAITAGQVIEFQGVPAVLGSTRVAKQEFYRLQFGTETVLVSSGLYGRMAPNQANRLTVLQRANLAIALNGVPLEKSERVRFDTGARSSMGWR